MSKWVSGHQLLKDFGIIGIELFQEYVKKIGLQPYNDLGQPISPQSIVEEITNIPWLTERYHQQRQSEEDLGGEELQKFDASRGHDLSTQISHYEEWIEASKNIDWMEFNLPETEAEAKSVIAILVNSLYQIEDIRSSFGVKSNLTAKNDTGVVAAVKSTSP